MRKKHEGNARGKIMREKHEGKTRHGKCDRDKNQTGQKLHQKQYKERFKRRQNMKFSHIKNILEQKKEENEKLILAARENIRNNHTEGRLRIGHSKKNVQYFQAGERFGNKGVYIKKENKRLICKLAEKDYNKKVCDIAEKQNRWIEKVLNDMPQLEVADIYINNQERRKLLFPFAMTTEEYAEYWSNIKYEGKSFSADFPEIITERGERVRSKSEKIIADKLYQMGIPYRYEYPLQLKGYGTVYPDFTLLNKSERKEIVYEHMGMMDNPEYATKNIEKIKLYESNGFLQGDRLILSFETSMHPINMNQVHKILERYCR